MTKRYLLFTILCAYFFFLQSWHCPQNSDRYIISSFAPWVFSDRYTGSHYSSLLWCTSTALLQHAAVIFFYISSSFKLKGSTCCQDVSLLKLLFRLMMQLHQARFGQKNSVGFCSSSSYELRFVGNVHSKHKSILLFFFKLHWRLENIFVLLFCSSFYIHLRKANSSKEPPGLFRKTNQVQAPHSDVSKAVLSNPQKCLLW